MPLSPLYPWLPVREMGVGRVLGIAGMVGGMGWIALALLTPMDTAANGGEAAWARLWAPPILLMSAGFAGLLVGTELGHFRAIRAGILAVVVGLSAMAVGNVAEYWFFVDEPHGDINARNLSWIVLLIGVLIAVIGSTVAGMALLRGRREPLWLGVAFTALFPGMIALAALRPTFVGVPLGALAIVTSFYVLSTWRRSLRAWQKRA
ncbi:MAG: hypothetical protein ABIP53_10760 [Candidatus Limnocylindrales bacterium]